MQVLRSAAMFAIVGQLTTAAINATPRDLSVFRAVIDQRIRREAPPAADSKSLGPWLVVLDRTFPFCDATLKLWCMPDHTRECLEAWLAQTDGGVALLRRFVLRNRAAVVVGNPDSAATVVASSGSIEALGTSDDFWRIFRTRYPGTQGWLRFSAPAYSEAGDAVVYVTYACGGLCGEGWLIRLSPVGSGWRITNWLSLWDA